MANAGNKNSKVICWIFLLIYSTIWGFSFVGTTTALQKLTTFELLAARWTIGAVIIGVLALIRVIKVDFRKKPVLAMVVCALVQPIAYSITETYGILMTTASEASIMIALSPILSLMASAFILRMRIGKVTAFAIILAFAGVLCTVVFAEDFSTGAKFLGYLILFLCAVSSATFCVLSSKLSEYFSPMERTLVMAVVGSVIFNICTLIEKGNLNYIKVCATDTKTLMAVLFLGVGCTFVAYVMCNYVLSKMPGYIVNGVQANLVTIVGAVSGIIINGDPWGWYTVVGLAMMIVGVLLVNRPEKE